MLLLGSELQLQSGKIFDYENVRQYSIYLYPQDSTGQGPGVTVQVNIIDVNEPPTITNLNVNITVNEDAKAYTIVHTVSIKQNTSRVMTIMIL